MLEDEDLLEGLLQVLLLGEEGGVVLGEVLVRVGEFRARVGVRVLGGVWGVGV